MSADALLPCLVCGKTLRNAFSDQENQPEDGTEFRSYGHYGSSFWDSMHGEELVLNVCDDCLRRHADRLGQHKRFRPVVVDRVGMVGRQWVDRPIVAYSGHSDPGDVKIEPEEIGIIAGVDWCHNFLEVRKVAIEVNDS